MEKLKVLIEKGLVADLMKAEEAFTVLNIINEKSAEINKSEFNVKNTFAFFQ